MNCYFSNLIEGNNTRPCEIEEALSGHLADNPDRRNLQIEARAHVSLQAEIDERYRNRNLQDPTSMGFIQWLHREFYSEMPEEFLTVDGVRIIPGRWRAEPPDVAVGRHLPPSYPYVPAFMEYFERQYGSVRTLEAVRVLAIPAAHHRFNYIHPFRDGNGRVSRLMSHAMMLQAGLGAHGLWSISRGLARGLNDRTQYKTMMNNADTPRLGDLDGRGNLSQRALRQFTAWFFKVCVDQIEYMSSLFEFRSLSDRIREMVKGSPELPDSSTSLLHAVLREGEVERSEVPKIMMLPERTARRVMHRLAQVGLLSSPTPKGKLFLEFPTMYVERLFPRIYD